MTGILNKKQSGVTLFELIVAMSIFLIISYIILSSTLTNRTAQAVAGATIFINSQSFQAGSTITKELMEAKSSTIEVGDSFVDTDSVTKYRQILFSIPVLDANGNLVTSPGGGVAFGDGHTEGNFIRYWLIGTNLVRQDLAADKVTVLSSSTVAQNLLSNSGFKTPNIAGSIIYNITLSFSIATYQGIPLPSSITSSITVAVRPQNN